MTVPNRVARCVFLSWWLAALAVYGAVAAAELPPAVKAVRAEVQGLGKRWDGEVLAATQAAYVELQRPVDRSAVRWVADLSYGEHPRHRLDLAVPREAPDDAMPVVVYLHGGGMVGGNKNVPQTDGLLYSNIPVFFARHGIIGINANYRLVPEASWPSGPDDIRAVLSWIRANIAGYGGDPEAVFLMGNSAGASHVAGYLFHRPSHFDDGPEIAGALLSSGAFSASDSETAIAYYGAERSLREARAPLGLVEAYGGPQVPVFLWSAEYDPGSIEVPVATMYAKLCSKYADCPRFTQFPGHNHVSHVMSLNTADGRVGAELLDFIRAVAR